jgi:hypothetical protein
MTIIDLSWTDNAENEDGFIIERKSSGLFYIVASLQANATSFSDAGLTEHTDYTYRGQAFNVGGYSGYSNEISSVTGENSFTYMTVTKGDMDLLPRIFPKKYEIPDHNCFFSFTLNWSHIGC